MNLNILLIDLLTPDGKIQNYRCVPINPYNSVMVDEFNSVYYDVPNQNTFDLGLVRVYHSHQCDISKIEYKPKQFDQFSNEKFHIQFNYSNIRVEYDFGNCGMYHFILPFGYRLTDLHIVEPYDKKSDITSKKHFEYMVYWYPEHQIQIVEMMLRSRRGSLSFIVDASYEKYQSSKSIFLGTDCFDELCTEQILENTNFFKPTAKKVFFKKVILIKS